MNVFCCLRKRLEKVSRLLPLSPLFSREPLNCNSKTWSNQTAINCKHRRNPTMQQFRIPSISPSPPFSCSKIDLPNPKHQQKLQNPPPPSHPQFPLIPINTMATIFLPFLLLLSAFLPSVTPIPIGFCHGRQGTNLPDPTTVLSHLHTHNITKLRLFNPDPTVLPAFKDSGIKLTIDIPNQNLTLLSDPDSALQYLKSNILSHLSPDDIEYLIVGNDILYVDTLYTPNLIPSIKNLHAALQTLGLDKKIKLSTLHSASILSNSTPPSTGQFDPFVLPVLKELLPFLSDTGAPLMVKLYPFVSYCEDPVNIPLGYVSFRPLYRSRDGDLTYTSLFDATIDAYVAAMEKEGFANVAVAVMETGWPKEGNDAATTENAGFYNGEITRRAVSGVGTPRRSGVAVETFLFDLYDEDEREGADFEKHFGVLNVDGTKAYNINFV